MPKLNQSNLFDIDKGTYVGIKYSESTSLVIKKIQDDLNLAFPVPIDKLHTTICYSTVKVPYTTSKDKNFEVGYLSELKVFETNDGKRALVAVIDSDWCKERHEYSNIIGANYSYPEYIPHITLSYDIGPLSYNYDFAGLPVLVASEEYCQDLDLDYIKKL